MKYKFEIKGSPIEGRGAFATELIKKGELICVMSGEEMSITELKRRYAEGVERSTDPLQITDEKYIDLDEPFVLINHSCEPNATLSKKNDLVAIKDIQKGEEITYDYSLSEWSDAHQWEGYEDWFFECRCGSPHCRKIISEFYAMPLAIQEDKIKQGYVRDFIVEKFRKANPDN